jgi:ribosome-associated protein
MTKTSVARNQISEINTGTSKLLDVIINSIEEKNGHEIKCLNLKNVDSAISDYFVICHGNSNTQVSAIANFIEREVKEKLNVGPFHTEGHENEEWILLDYFDVIVHIFHEEKRTFYQIEELWADATPMQL